MKHITKLLFLIVIALIAGTVSHMAAAQAINFVQVNSFAPPSAGSLTTTFSSAQAAGNLNIVVIGWSDTTTTVTSVSDSQGNNYQLAANYASSSLGMTQSIYYANYIAAASAGANTVRVTLSASTSYPDLRIAEYNGVNTLDKTSSAGGTSTTANSGAVTTTVANELLFGTNYTYGNTNGPGSGYTSRVITNNGDIAEDAAVSSAGTYSATASVTAANWIMQLATFSGGGAPPPVNVSVSPTSATAQVNQTQQFTATVTGTSNTTVTWQVNGVTGGNSTVGTIATSGLYTAPASVPNPATVTVRAVSQADTTKSASASVNIAFASASSFYVSPMGNDSNNGTINLPWRTVTHAIGQVSSGSTIVARAGVYNERVVINKALTLQSYPGELGIVDGTGVPMVSGPYAYGLVDIASGTSNVTISGLEIRNFIATAASFVPAGIHMEGVGSNIQILNNHIHHIQNKASYSGKKDGSCGGSPPNAFGLVIAGTSGTASINNFTIRGNELDHLITGCSESMTANGNTQSFTIENNVVHDNSNIGIAALGGEGVAPAHDYASNGTIRGNTVYNIYSSSQAGNAWDVYGTACDCADGIYLDGSDSIVVERNLVHHVDWGTETTGEKAGQNTTNITVRDNLYYSNKSAGMGIGGQGNPGGAANITVVNNTFYNNDTSSAGNGTLSLGASISGSVIFKNNIVYTSASAQTVTGQTSTSGLSFDYNLYYGGVSPFSEAHSLHANPQFVNLAVTPPNLDTQGGSPARGAGTNLGSTVVGTVDYAGNPRVQGSIDMGAYEH